MSIYLYVHLCVKENCVPGLTSSRSIEYHTSTFSTIFRPNKMRYCKRFLITMTEICFATNPDNAFQKVIFCTFPLNKTKVQILLRSIE